MRKRIKKLAIGMFDDNEPKLSFSVERIELQVIEGKDATGEFTICSKNKKIRGIVYSTYPRMECLTPQFDGEEVRIRYQFHSEGLFEGDIRKGEFVIVCEQGEYNLSFVVSVSKLYAASSIGKIKNLSDFARLARDNFNESYKIFYSASFPNVIKEKEEKERLLYETIRKEPPSMQAVEAFLVGAEQKQPVWISLDEKERTIDNVTEDRKEQVTLKKDKWGYVSCRVICDAAFIKLSKETLSSEEFLGNTCFYDYYIKAKELHAGKNYGEIRFCFPRQTLSVKLCVHGAKKGEKNTVSLHREYMEGKAGLTKLYIDYRLKKIVTGVWAKNSIQILDRMLDAKPDCSLYQLMKAQAFLINRQRQEASWILEDYKRSCQNRETPEWGYYLYLCTLMERDETYVNRVAGQIEELFRHHPKNSLLFWILLFVREDYFKNSSHRLKAIERWIASGADSPYFYLEAYYLYLQDPYLLTKLGDFEIKILSWAGRYQALSKEVAMQVFHLVNSERIYNEKVFNILKVCYEVTETETEEALAAICGYLIKGQKFTTEYHNWYELGVEQELRITNLYEAYLLTSDESTIEKIPKVVFMYFQYHNSLSYKQLALLYAHIVKRKEEQKEIYLRYRRTIEQFAMSQIEAGHIDDNLAIIYQDMLPLGILNEELAEKFSDVLFIHRLKVEKDSNFVRAIILQKQWKSWQNVPITDGEAYFTAMTEDYCILLMDGDGFFDADKENFVEYPLLSVEEYMESAARLAPDCLPYLVCSFHKKLKENDFSAADEESMAILLHAKEVREEWKAELLPAFVRHFAAKDFGSRVEEFLQSANYKLMSFNDRKFMVEQLIENHFYEQAYEMIETYGYDTLDNAYRVSICSYQITTENFEENEFLIGLADDTFRAGKYNDVILIYLCKYYNGPTKHMAEIWKAAGEFEIDTFDLEERIITQMLYSTDYVEQIDEIYESYCRGGGREMVCMAYLTYFSQLYLCKDAIVAADVFSQIEYKRLMHQELNDTQCLALLKNYSELEIMTEVQCRIADELLLNFTCQGIYFEFYKKLDHRLVDKYHLNDKFFVEYHTKPGTLVTISYQMNGGSYHEEEMPEVYDGIFVKPFILFFSDILSYYITETDETYGQSITISGRLENHDVYSNQNESRYAMLNDMLLQLTLQEDQTLKREMMEYHGKKVTTEEIFKVL